MKTKLFTLLTLLLCAITSAWAQEEIFSAIPIATSNVTNTQIEATAFTAEQATVSGGTMYMVNTESSSRTFINTSVGPTGDKRKCFQIGANKQFYKIVLSKALAEGDVISADFYNTNVELWLTTATARPSSAPTAKVTKGDAATSSTWSEAKAYTVEEGDGICGETTFYVYRNSNTTSFTNFKITRPVVDSRPAAPISWSASSAVATLGQDNTFPTLTNSSDLTVTYASGNASIATINASTGAINLVAKGTTTISATYTTTGESDTYKTTKVSYELTVSDLTAVSDKFWKFTDAAWSSYTPKSSNNVVDNIEIITDNTGHMTLVDASYTVDGIAFTKGMNTGGSSTSSRRVLHLLVAPGSMVTAYVRPNGTSRSVIISNGEYDNTKDQNKLTDASSSAGHKLTHPNIAGGDVYIHGTNNFTILGIKVEPLQCGEPTFSPNGGSIEEGASVIVTSTDAATIKYAWTADDVATPAVWLSATATDNAITVTVPDAADNTPRLHAYGVKDGYADGDAAYVDFTITGADNTAPVLTNQSVTDGDTEVAAEGTITLTFDENVQVANVAGVTLTGGAATISSVTAENNVVTIAYTGLAYNTTYTLAVASGAITDIATAHNAYTGTSFSFTTAKEAMPNPTITALGYFQNSQTVTIDAIDGATVTYSFDNETFTDYTVPFEITDSKTIYAKATHADYSGEGEAEAKAYLVTVPDAQEDVTDEFTWDFNNGLMTSSEISGTAESVELLSTVTGYAEKVGATQISFLGRNVYRTGYAQAHGFVINTTVPGKLSLNVSGTNNNTRYVYVNGERKGSVNNSTAKNINDIDIPAGTTIVYGFDVTAVPNVPNNIRYYKITFTPATETVTVSSAEYATFAPVNTVAVPADVTAYIVSETSASSVTLDEVTVIPAGTPVIVYKESAADTEVTFTATDADASDVSGNRLQVSASPVTADGTQYVLAQVEGVVGFHKVTAETTIAAGKAYLVSPAGANFLRFDFDDETTGITNNNREDITNNGEYFNLAGQRVAQPAKGLYIMNGKKVVIR